MGSFPRGGSSPLGRTRCRIHDDPAAKWHLLMSCRSTPMRSDVASEPPIPRGTKVETCGGSRFEAKAGADPRVSETLACRPLRSSVRLSVGHLLDEQSDHRQTQAPEPTPSSAAQRVRSTSGEMKKTGPGLRSSASGASSCSVSARGNHAAQDGESTPGVGQASRSSIAQLEGRPAVDRASDERPRCADYSPQPLDGLKCPSDSSQY